MRATSFALHPSLYAPRGPRIVRRGNPIVTREMRDEVAKVLSGTSFILGENVNAFETAFARYCGSDYCVGVSSGTSALHLSLLAAGVGPGDQVITSPLSFFSTASSIIHAGAVPVFADVDRTTLTIDPQAVAKLISAKTKAILPVHLYGHPAEMKPLSELAEEHRLKIIEDAAEAHGAMYRGRRVGSSPNHLTAFSFYPTKNITCCGDGGAVLTGNSRYAHNVRLLRNFGLDGQGNHRMLGHNMRLSEIGSAILRIQLRYLEKWVERRREIARIYREEIRSPQVAHPEEARHARHAYYLYVVRAIRRRALARFLADKGVETGVHFHPVLYKIPCIANSSSPPRSPCSVAEQASNRVLSLPMNAALTDEEVVFVSKQVDRFYKSENRTR